MMRTVQHRRGFMLIIVLATMALIAGIVAGMTYHAGALHGQLQQQRIDTTMRYATESAAAYVSLHSDDWVNNPPTESLKLDSEALMRGTMTAEMTIDCEPSAKTQTCVVKTKLTHHRRSTRKSIPIRLDKANSSE